MHEVSASLSLVDLAITIQVHSIDDSLYLSCSGNAKLSQLPRLIEIHLRDFSWRAITVSELVLPLEVSDQSLPFLVGDRATAWFSAENVVEIHGTRVAQLDS